MPYVFKLDKLPVLAKIEDGWLFLGSKAKNGDMYLYRLDLGKVCSIGMKVIPGKVPWGAALVAFVFAGFYYYSDPFSGSYSFDTRWFGTAVLLLIGLIILFFGKPPGNTVLRITTESGEVVDLDGVDSQMEELEGYLWEAIQKERGFV
ncbi:MAG: hypothetical protein KatS3mg071_2761 [Meiothermus sp.]|nr:MAG: hypothetical protein KatS3mg071_2761 [Meiothermus sp.]